MSTRGAIARRTPEGWAGRYHHSDSYPTGLGAALWEALHGHFKGDVGAMLRMLIDEHPAGWSSILNVDWTVAPGFREPTAATSGVDHLLVRPPRCYCHGDRAERAWSVTSTDDGGMEWAYVFDEADRTLTVLERVYTEDAGGKRGKTLAGRHMTGMFGVGAPGRQQWARRGVFKLDGAEPNWPSVECGPHLEHCVHYRWYHDPSICRSCDGKLWVESGGHAAGFGAQQGLCGPACVPDSKAPTALRNGTARWHHTGISRCTECGGTGRAPDARASA